MNRLSIAIGQIDDTRRYTQMVLEHTPTERWTEMAGGSTSHVTWQVGHITWAEASHVIAGVCDQPIEGLMPDHYKELFGKGSTPVPDARRYPGPAELLEVMHRVHEKALNALGGIGEEVMDEPASHSTGLIRNKFERLMWVARHEMLHVGQVGLIRRQLGLGPYR